MGYSIVLCAALQLDHTINGPDFRIQLKLMFCDISQYMGNIHRLHYVIGHETRKC